MMSSLYFGLDVFCQFGARVREFDMMYYITQQLSQYFRGKGCMSNKSDSSLEQAEHIKPKIQQ